MMRKTLALLSIIVMLQGCSSNEISAPIPAETAAAPSVIWHNAAPLVIDPARIALRPRRSIGTYSRNVGCFVNVRPFTDADFPTASNVTDAIRDGFARAGISVTVGVEPGKAPTFLIKPTVASAHIDLCNGAFLEDGPNDVDAEVDILWQVIEVQTGQTVFETRTVGVGHSANTTMDLAPAVDLALGDADIRLLQIGSIQRYLGGGGLAPLAPVSATQPLAAPVAASAATSAERAAPVPQEEVTADGIIIPLKLAGIAAPTGLTPKPAGAIFTLDAMGHRGYAVMISDAGYALTLGSLLDHATTVKLIISGADPVAAALLRMDQDTGIALLKIPAMSGRALVISTRHAVIGADIAAFGDQGAISGKIVGTADSAGHVPTTLPGVTAGSPIMDSTGNLLGIAESGTAEGVRMLPIATAFHNLHLGAALPDN